MKKVKRFVCDACGGNYIPEHALNNRCPGCKGTGSVKEVQQDDAGVVHVRSDD